jgi:hypothetical protein
LNLGSLLFILPLPYYAGVYFLRENFSKNFGLTKEKEYSVKNSLFFGKKSPNFKKKKAARNIDGTLNFLLFCIFLVASSAKSS